MSTIFERKGNQWGTIFHPASVWAKSMVFARTRKTNLCKEVKQRIFELPIQNELMGAIN